jgi:uncharacterized membrane protein
MDQNKLTIIGGGGGGRGRQKMHMEMINRGFTVFFITKEIMNSVLNLQSSIKSYKCHHPLITSNPCYDIILVCGLNSILTSFTFLLYTCLKLLIMKGQSSHSTNNMYLFFLLFQYGPHMTSCTPIKISIPFL